MLECGYTQKGGTMRHAKAREARTRTCSESVLDLLRSFRSDDPGKWEVRIGWHRGTIATCESDTFRRASLRECRREVRRLEKLWAKVGCYVWFAKAYQAVNPYETERVLHPGTTPMVSS